jgi:hypothetical protein
MTTRQVRAQAVKNVINDLLRTPDLSAMNEKTVARYMYDVGAILHNLPELVISNGEAGDQLKAICDQITRLPGGCKKENAGIASYLAKGFGANYSS